MSEAKADVPVNQPPVLVVVPDVNVLIHGKSLPDLPWEELGRPEVEVLFVPATIRELDKLKNQPGRPNRIARQLSSDIRQMLALPEQRAEVRRGATVVTKRVELRPVTEAKFPGLRLDHADQALINYALHVKGGGLDVVLLTDDTICGATAEEHGLPTIYLFTHWLREIEPDEAAKEIAKLKAENRRLSLAEPQVEISFRLSDGQPVEILEATVSRWPALNQGQLDELMSEIEHRCPPVTVFDYSTEPSGRNRAGASNIEHLLTPSLASFEPRFVYDPPTEEEIERYRTVTFPEWHNSIRTKLASLHDELTQRIKWPTIIAVASNRGTRPAAEVLVTLRAHGALTMSDRREEIGNSNPLDQLPRPPAPPRGRRRRVDPFGLHGGVTPSILQYSLPNLPELFSSARLPHPRQADAFYWRESERSHVEELKLDCSSWRHGEEAEEFHVTVHPKEPADTSGAIEFTVQAANLSTPASAKLPVRFRCVDGPTLDKARELVEALVQARTVSFPT